MSEWINVKDGYPEETMKVFAYASFPSNAKLIITQSYTAGQNQFPVETPDDGGVTVTHWMPLPDAPQEGAEGDWINSDKERPQRAQEILTYECNQKGEWSMRRECYRFNNFAHEGQGRHVAYWMPVPAEP